MDSLEKKLRKDVSEVRQLEMEKYGRTKIYDHISEFLQGDMLLAFSLVNHSLAIIDDGVDAGSNKEQLNKAKTILTKGFQGGNAENTEICEGYIYELGLTLSKLHISNFHHAVAVFNEIINYWEIEIQNLDRKGTILKSNDLDNLNLRIGESVSLQFLYLLCPNLDKESRKVIASSYGIAIKLADNLSDLNEDLERGYINISRENIEKYQLNISSINDANLQSYKETEFRRIKQYYEEGDKIVDEILENDPSQEKGLITFKEIAHSWLKQVADEI